MNINSRVFLSECDSDQFFIPHISQFLIEISFFKVICLILLKVWYFDEAIQWTLGNVHWICSMVSCLFIHERYNFLEKRRNVRFFLKVLTNTWISKFFLLMNIKVAASEHRFNGFFVKMSFRSTSYSAYKPIFQRNIFFRRNLLDSIKSIILLMKRFNELCEMFTGFVL